MRTSFYHVSNEIYFEELRFFRAVHKAQFRWKIIKSKWSKQYLFDNLKLFGCFYTLCCVFFGYVMKSKRFHTLARTNLHEIMPTLADSEESSRNLKTRSRITWGRRCFSYFVLRLWLFLFSTQKQISGKAANLILKKSKINFNVYKK